MPHHAGRPSGPLRVDFVTGVTPDKWARTWAARHPDDPLHLSPIDEGDAEARLRSGATTLSLLRLPVDRAGLHVIPLYEEAPVVVVAKEHAAAAFDALDVDRPRRRGAAPSARLACRRGATPLPPTCSSGPLPMPPMTVVEAIAVAATGSGFVVVPLSVARVHHRKDVVHRPVTGVAGSQVALAWRVDDDDPRIEDFIGVVRGRTERSSRGRAGDDGRRRRQRTRRVRRRVADGIPARGGTPPPDGRPDAPCRNAAPLLDAAAAARAADARMPSGWRPGCRRLSGWRAPAP